MVNETKVEPPVPFHILLPPPKPSVDPKVDLPDAITEKFEIIKRPVSKNPKANPTANAKGKKNAWHISRIARNKAKPTIDQNPIDLSEDSDSDIENFLASEYPYSQGLCSEPPYDFVLNLAPCLKNNPKPTVEQKPIVLSEDSDSDIEHFLASEYPYSQGLCPEPPYDFILNIPPCLRNNPSYPRIKLPNKTLSNMSKPSPAPSKLT